MKMQRIATALTVINLALLREVLRLMKESERSCECGSALQHAIFTAPNLWPEATTKKLEAIIKKYQA